MFASKDTLLTRPSGGYNIARSVRLRSSASAYFNRTPGSAGNRQIFTISAWCKRGALSTESPLFTATDGTNRFYSRFETNETISVYFFTGGIAYDAGTTAVFRDPSAWYHIVIAIDTTQATASNRLKVYVNNVQQTITTSVPQNTSTMWNNTVQQNIGKKDTSGTYFDGYLTEINNVDGQQLTPSSFGSTNAITGVWQPAKYTGTYGTNGFYLNFSDNSSNTATTIGKDYSGNGNNWTPNNISVTAGATYDSMVDSPTVGATSSNYCVWSPIDKGSVTVTNGNLTAVATADVAALRGTMGLPQSGKWYWETTLSAQGYGTGLGIADNACPISNFNAGSTQSRTFQWGSFSGGVTLYGTNQSVLSGTSWAGASQVASNDVVMIAVDMDNGSMWVGKNGTWFNSSGTANPATNTDPRWTGLTGTTWFPVYASYGTGSPPTANANFGQRPFSYSAPTGFVALNTYNLPASTITNGAGYMAATTYTGNGSTQSISNAVGSTSFQPDFVWIKLRNQAGDYHNLFDSVRGVYKRLFSNDTNAENTNTDTLTAFNSNGFSVGTNGNVNTNAINIIGWQWKAGGTSSSNTNGSITSTVSVGATQGFSVVTYTGNGTAGATVGHGLGAVPQMFIVKSRSAATSWNVYHVSTGNTGAMFLETTNAFAADSTRWNNTSPTSTVFSLGNGGGVNASAGTFVAYCFSAVAGYSAFGSYTGNGSADGPFVYTGFRPRFFMIKRTDTTTNWIMYDTTRMPYNSTNPGPIYANLSSAEETNITLTAFDILSNGFKPRNTSSWAESNASGGTYIYMAFAEVPFKSALAR